MTIEITSREVGGMSWDHEAAVGDGVLVIFVWHETPYIPEVGNRLPIDRAFYGDQEIPLHLDYGQVGGGADNSFGDQTNSRGIQVLWLSLPNPGIHTITLESDHGYSVTSVSYMLSGSIGPLIPFFGTGGGGGNQHFQFELSEPPGTISGGGLNSNGSHPSTENFLLGAANSTVGVSNSSTDVPLADVGTQEVVDSFGDTLVLKKYPSSPVLFAIGGYIDAIQWDIPDGDLEEDFWVAASIILVPTPVVEPPIVVVTSQPQARHVQVIG